VWSVVVVPAQPAGECACAVGACWVDVAVGPFALQDADERLGFAVRFGRVWPGADVTDAVLGEQASEGVAAIPAAVVGEDALDRRAVVGVVADHLGGEGRAVGAALRCAQLHDGVAGVVIHRDVGVLPSSAVIATDAVLEDAFADLPEAAQLLDVQVHQLTHRGVLIPIRRRPWLALGA